MQSELSFIRHPKSEYAVVGTTPSNQWKYPGDALSASSIRLYADMIEPVRFARWTLVWNPRAGVTYNAVRIVSADDGPSNVVEMAFINRNATSTPVVSAVDITDKINQLILAGVPKHILMQTCGDSPSLIFRSTIDLVW